MSIKVNSSIRGNYTAEHGAANDRTIRIFRSIADKNDEIEATRIYIYIHWSCYESLFRWDLKSGIKFSVLRQIFRILEKKKEINQRVAEIINTLKNFLSMILYNFGKVNQRYSVTVEKIYNFQFNQN